MNRVMFTTALVSMLALASLVDAQRKKAKVLRWPRTVAEAKEEARLRNVPIVLHIHGNT